MRSILKRSVLMRKHSNPHLTLRNIFSNYSIKSASLLTFIVHNSLFMSMRSHNTNQPIVKLWHLSIFGLLIVASIICNTKSGEKVQKQRQEWAFHQDRVILYANEFKETHKKPVYRDLRVVLDGKLLYEDQKSNFVSNFGILPIVRQLENNQFEILVGFQENSGEKILHLIGREDSLILNDTLPLFKGNHSDRDRDGMPEFSGFLEKFPAYCQECDSLYYNPYLIYEMRPERFVLDTLLTRQWIENHYDRFAGFKPDSNLLVKKKKPLTEI